MNVLRQAETYLQSSKFPAQLAASKTSAMAFLQEHGLPKRTQAEWHYTSTKDLSTSTYTPFLDKQIDLSLWKPKFAQARIPEAINLFFVNDLLALEASDSTALLNIDTLVRGSDFQSSLYPYDGLQALTEIFRRHTVRFQFAKTLSQPVVFHLFSENSEDLASLSAIDWMFDVPKGVAADVLIQRYSVPESRHLQLGRLHVAVQEKGSLNLADVRNGHSLFSWFSQTHLQLKAEAKVQALQFFGGEGWFRNNVTADLMGEGADVLLQGLSYCRKEAHCDHFLTVQHQVGNTKSAQKYKGILDQGAKTIFTGKVRIEHLAQKSAAVQLAKFLQLDDKSEFNARPILEIFADDVKANHGASTGFLDPEEVFYLRSRGLSESLTQRILKEAFLADLLETIPPGLLQSTIRKNLQSYFVENPVVPLKVLGQA